MKNDMAYTLISAEQIEKRVSELGAELTRDFEGKNPLLVSVLKGSFIFMADLIRHIDIHCSMDFMAVSSYGNKTETSGVAKIYLDLSESITGRHIILVEDILDSGVTLSYLVNYLGVRNPASVTIVTLLDKPARRQADVKAHYIGFEIPDAFVVGYGLDFDERYRNLPFIGVLKPEVYSE